MKILIFSEYLFTGGIASYVLQLNQNLLSEGYFPELIASDLSDDVEVSLIKSGIRFRKVDLKYNHFIFSYLERLVKFFFISLSIISHGKNIDYILLNTPISGLAFILASKILNQKNKLYYQFHGAIDLEERLSVSHFNKYFNNANHYFNKLFSIFKLFILNKTQYFVYHNTNKIIVFSEYSKSILNQNFNIPLVKIYKILPGVIGRKTNIFEKIIFSNRQIILVVSRLESRKGIYIFILALKQLKNLNSQFLAIIQSDFSNDLQLTHIYRRIIRENNLENNVLLIQYIDSKQRDQLYAIADLVVIPSVGFETFSFTTLEAYQNGVPVCAFNIGANSEILIEKECLLVDSITAEKLANVMNKYLSLDKKTKNKIKRNISKKIKIYNWQTYIKSLFH